MDPVSVNPDRRKKKVRQAMLRHLPVFVVTALFGLVLCGCMNPTDQTGVEVHTVTVNVQDKSGAVQRDIQVDIFSGEALTQGAIPLDSKFTGSDGSVQLQVPIPFTGGTYLIQAGNEDVGKVQARVQLVSKDTSLVVVLELSNLGCNVQLKDTLVIRDVCAPLQDGRSFSDSVQRTFRSGCTVPLNVTYTPLNEPFDLRMTILDASGREVTSNPFVLPPRQNFAIKVVSHPKAPGSLTRTVRFTGTGAENASIDLEMLVFASAIPCANSTCTDTTVRGYYPVTLINSVAQSVVQRLEFNKNTSPVLRTERVVKRFTNSDVFVLLDSLRGDLEPGASQNVRLRFTPRDMKRYVDTMIIESNLVGSSDRCTTRVVMQGEGCGPVCRMPMQAYMKQGSGPDDYVISPPAIHPDDQTAGFVYFYNEGECGALNMYHDTAGVPTVKGFYFDRPFSQAVPPDKRDVFFRTFFEAKDNVIWPQGHGRPAQSTFTQVMRIKGCGPEKTINVKVTIDTLPIQYFSCVYQWSENGNYGYNFDPIATKGVQSSDPTPTTSQLTDMIVESIVAGSSAQMRIRDGWKFIRANVSETDFDFQKVRTWPEYLSMTSGTFSQDKVATFSVRSVYVVRIYRGYIWRYALVRVREASVDGDQKHKICVDVMYPMIKESGS